MSYNKFTKSELVKTLLDMEQSCAKQRREDEEEIKTLKAMVEDMRFQKTKDMKNRDNKLIKNFTKVLGINDNLSDEKILTLVKPNRELTWVEIFVEIGRLLERAKK